MSRKTCLASSRDQTSLVKGLSRAMISRIFFSIAAQVVGRERLVAGEVVIEAVLDHRADGHLRAGPQRLHGLGQHVRGVVADQLQRARVVAGDEFDLARRARSDRRDRRARRRAPSPRCAWRARARCPWRCRARWCLGDSRGARRRERSVRPFSAPVAHSLPTNAGKRNAKGYSRGIGRRNSLSSCRISPGDPHLGSAGPARAAAARTQMPRIGHFPVTLFPRSGEYSRLQTSPRRKRRERKNDPSTKMTKRCGGGA